MMYSELLKNTNIEKMLGGYTNMSNEVIYGLFVNYLEPIYMHNAWDSKEQYYKALDKLGVNAFIDKYLNVACLRLIDDVTLSTTRYVDYACPNTKYVPEKLARELKKIYDSVVVDWSFIGGQIHCKKRV